MTGRGASLALATSASLSLCWAGFEGAALGLAGGGGFLIEGVGFLGGPLSSLLTVVLTLSSVDSLVCVGGDEGGED